MPCVPPPIGKAHAPVDSFVFPDDSNWETLETSSEGAAALHPAESCDITVQGPACKRAKLGAATPAAWAVHDSTAPMGAGAVSGCLPYDGSCAMEIPARRSSSSSEEEGETATGPHRRVLLPLPIKLRRVPPIGQLLTVCTENRKPPMLANAAQYLRVQVCMGV